MVKFLETMITVKKIYIYQCKREGQRIVFYLFVENKTKMYAGLPIVGTYIYIYIIVEIPTHVSLAPEGINIKKTH